MSARSRLAVLELAAGQVGSISPARADHEQAAIPLQTHSTEVSSAADLAGAKAPLQSSGSRRCCSAATFALDADSRPRIRELLGGRDHANGSKVRFAEVARIGHNL